MSDRPNKRKQTADITRCGTAYERHFSEGIVDLDKGYENEPMITVYKLEEVLPQLNNFLPPVRQSGQWITLVTKGSGEKSIGDHHFEIRDNTLFLAGRRTAQSSRYFSRNVTGYTLIFDIEKLSTMMYKGGIIRERKVLISLIQPFLYLSSIQSQQIADLMNSIYEEKISGGGTATELMALKTAELLIQCDRLFESHRLIRHSIQRLPVLDHFLSLVEEHVHHEHRAAFYREELALQAAELNMILRAHSLGSVSTIIRDKLINDMKLLLNSTRLSISAIANSLGFNSARSCTQYFTRNTGLSPSAFRGDQEAMIREIRG